ncbi:MAG TPA: WcaI family glycosyltransferase [Opitutaceae bacterium]|nr:WcaI family glycosyltransferase [Opitutaceae bacterium]
MRILVWGINYAPEPTGIAPFNTGLCEWLAERGHAVEMVTTFPYYPAWRKRPEDRGALYRTERRAGVNVRRCWHFVPERVTSWRRILHEASFLATALPRVLSLRRADVIVVVSPPLPLGVPAWIVSRLWRRPYVFHVQDLQPDAAVGLGMLRPGRFTQLLYALERFAYRRAAAVSGISDGMLAAFRAKGVEDARRLSFPNWVADALPGAAGSGERAAARDAVLARHGLDRGEFLLVYSGNLGMKQGLGVLLEAAGAAASGTALRWIVAGDGAGKEALVRSAAERGLERVTFLPLQPDDAFIEMLIAADVCVITQQKGTGQFFFPSKLLTALARAKPILAVADDASELARAVTQGRFGLVAPPDDPAAVAQAAAAMAAAGEAQLAEWGRNGLAWVSRFRRSAVLGEFERELARLAGNRGGMAHADSARERTGS